MRLRRALGCVRVLLCAGFPCAQLMASRPALPPPLPRRRQQMRLATDAHPVLLAEPSFNSKAAREKAVELLFEKYQSPGACVGWENKTPDYLLGWCGRLAGWPAWRRQQGGASCGSGARRVQSAAHRPPPCPPAPRAPRAAVFMARNAVLSSFATGRQTSLVVDAGHARTVGECRFLSAAAAAAAGFSCCFRCCSVLGGGRAVAADVQEDPLPQPCMSRRRHSTVVSLQLRCRGVTCPPRALEKHSTIRGGVTVA